MKREYTLLILGIITSSISWIGLTQGQLKIIFTLVGLGMIILAYRYRYGKNTKTNTKEPVKMPTPETIVVEPETTIAPNQSLEEDTNFYESRHQTKPRI